MWSENEKAECSRVAGTARRCLPAPDRSIIRWGNLGGKGICCPDGDVARVWTGDGYGVRVNKDDAGGMIDDGLW